MNSALTCCFSWTVIGRVRMLLLESLDANNSGSCCLKKVTASPSGDSGQEIKSKILKADGNGYSKKYHEF